MSIRRRTVKLSPEQQARHAEIRRQVESEKGQLSRDAHLHKAERDALISAFHMLKAERERRGMSLGDISRHTGIDRSYLSKLENDPAPNPTLSTLLRIADALGVKLTIGITQGAA